MHENPYSTLAVRVMNDKVAYFLRVSSQLGMNSAT